MKLRPDYGDPYFNLGSVLFQQGRTDEAIAQWQKALATQPNDAGFHTALGSAFLTKGLHKDAIAEYEHATRIFPRDFVARNNLAWLLATSSMLQFAMANAQSSWPNKPCNSRAAKMRIISGLSRLPIRRLVGFPRLLQSPNKLQPWLPCRGRPTSRIVSRKTLCCTKNRCRFAKPLRKTSQPSSLKLTSPLYDTVNPVRTTRFRPEARWTKWCCLGCSLLPTHAGQSL